MTPDEKRLHQACIRTIRSGNGLAHGFYIVNTTGEMVALEFVKGSVPVLFWVWPPVLVTALSAILSFVVQGDRTDHSILWVGIVALLTSGVFGHLAWRHYRAPRREQLLVADLQEGLLHFPAMNWTLALDQLDKLALRQVKTAVDEDKETIHECLYAWPKNAGYILLTANAENDGVTRRTNFVPSIREFCRRAKISLMEPPADRQIDVPFV
jgi:hypothetical protein